MALNKEQVLTLTCLKEVGVKGVGPQKIFAIGAAIDERELEIKSYEDLAKLMSGMKEKAINKVTLANLNDAYTVAKKIVEASSQSNIGYVGYYDSEFPDVLRKTVNEEGIVTDCSRTGGSHGWQLYSISRWSKEDGEELLTEIKQILERGNFPVSVEKSKDLNFS